MKKKKDLFKPLRNKVQRLFAENARSILNYKQIAARLDLNSSEERNQLLLVLKNLQKDEILEEVRTGKYAAVFKHQFVYGRMELTQRGSGFLIPENKEENSEDIFISGENLNTALDGDQVKVNLFPFKNNGRPCGEVIEICQRKQEQFAGIVQMNHGYAFVVPDDKKMYSDIFIPGDKTNKAKQGQKVIARLIEWNAGEKNPLGEIIEILGKPGEHETEMHAIVSNFGFQMRFPEAVEKECKKLPLLISKKEISERVDYRKVCTFTIDPEDAKDFDDALSIQKLNNGNTEIGIHIADVSYYVKPNSAIDQEAFERGTSVYLVDRTIPMLPEILSNQLCSLRPNEDKLCFSVIVEMNNKAEVINHRIERTVIHSQRRFTYEEAQQRIESGEGDLSEELNQLNILAKQLQSERFKNGAVAFETQEVKFKLDEHFRPVDVYVKIRKDAHKLIEEFMLLANRLIAEAGSYSGRSKNKSAFVYRVHEEPADEKLQSFSRFATRFGYQLPQLSSSNASRNLNQFLKQVEGKPEQNLLQNLAIRTMQKAFYTSKKHGHYGLAFEYYTHFTSPIRRYPDLMVHRLIAEKIENGKLISNELLEKQCEHTSLMEARAAEAERASIRYKQVEYIRDYIGETFSGIISGVTEWGIYIEITRFRCEGMIRLQALDDDYYEFDERNQWIIGRHSKRRFQLGDSIDVIVAAADLQKRQIDFELAQKSTVNRNQKRMFEKKIKTNKRKR